MRRDEMAMNRRGEVFKQSRPTIAEELLHRKIKVDQLNGIVSSLTGTPLDQKVK